MMSRIRSAVGNTVHRLVWEWCYPPLKRFVLWWDCVLSHRKFWTRESGYHSWFYKCNLCGRRWTIPD